MAQFGRAKWWLLAIVLLLGWCKLTEPSASYRFRMTVEAETPQGSKRASGVYAVHAEKHWVLTSEEKPGSAWIVGEAIALEAGNGPIFVLMDAPVAGDDLGGNVTYALSRGKAQGGIDSYLPAVQALGGWFGHARAELPRDAWPSMVRFRDINRPETAERVDPAMAGIKRITIETTWDPVTTGIRKTLGWLGTDPLILGNSGRTTRLELAGGRLNNRAFWFGTDK